MFFYVCAVTFEVRAHVENPRHRVESKFEDRRPSRYDDVADFQSVRLSSLITSTLDIFCPCTGFPIFCTHPNVFPQTNVTD